MSGNIFWWVYLTIFYLSGYILTIFYLSGYILTIFLINITRDPSYILIHIISQEVYWTNMALFGEIINCLRNWEYNKCNPHFFALIPIRFAFDGFTEVKLHYEIIFYKNEEWIYFVLTWRFHSVYLVTVFR